VLSKLEKDVPAAQAQDASRLLFRIVMTI